MAIEGELHVAARWRHGRLESVRIRSTRPLVAGRLLVGRPADEVCRLVPSLYAVCGRSQAVAAALACESARGHAADDATDRARTALVVGELMQEAAFQALVEWPRTWLADAVDSRSLRVLAASRRTSTGAAAPLLGALAPCTSVVAEPGVGSAAGAMRDALAPAMRAVLGTAPGKWLERVEHEGLDGWLDEAGTPTAAALRAAGAASGFGASEVGTLPPPEPAMLDELARAMDAEPDFEREPLWRGAPAETGAIARVAGSAGLGAFVGDAGNRALARCEARLVELAALAVDESRVLSGGLPLAPGAGIGWVETARGLLVHRVAVDMDGRVLGYRIVAPTEWNFHPEGALPRGLAGAAFGDCAAAERGARWLVQSLDPCVAAHVEVGHA